MAKTSSFITEIPLQADDAQVTVLNKRFEAARQVYNACLGEGLRRLDLMRQSKAWQQTRKMPRGNSKSDNPIKRQQAKDRQEAFRTCQEKFDLVGKYSLAPFAQQFNRCWTTDHLGSQLIAAISKKAFVWIMEYVYDKERGRPKFKRYTTYNSVESGGIGKEFLFERIDNEYVFSWTIGQLFDREQEKFSGKGSIVKLKAIIDPKDEVLQHGLSSRLKYVRLVRRQLNGVTRFYAQLVCEGKPYQRFELGKGVTGLDIGPSTVAIVSDNGIAKLLRFCDELQDSQKEIKTLQRKIDRQRRANNPDNYEPDWWVYPKGQKPRLKKGKVIEGSRRWKRSNSQTQNEVKLKEIKRKQREYRKSLHGQLVNTIIQMCDTVRLEKLSYKAFQRLFGKSVGVRAPGMFVARLRQKMNDLEGLVEEFSTYNTKLSQRCHCGRLLKKSLSQRWHKCECGVIAQRDLYSAFLATCVEDGEFNALIANEQWRGLGSVLRTALNDVQTGNGVPASFGLNQSQSQLSERHLETV